MDITQKGKLIGDILSQLQFMADTEHKPFDYGDTFLSLTFKSDTELQNIARLCGVTK
jgi:hypothetical protein